MSRVVVLVDGEHHPAAVRAALESLSGDGYEIAGAVFCGGTEKVDVDQARRGLRRRRHPRRRSAAGARRTRSRRWRPDAVLDLTDEPILVAGASFRPRVACAGRRCLVPRRGLRVRRADLRAHRHEAFHPRVRHRQADGQDGGGECPCAACCRARALAPHRRGGPGRPQPSPASSRQERGWTPRSSSNGPKPDITPERLRRRRDDVGCDDDRLCSRRRRTCGSDVSLQRARRRAHGGRTQRGSRDLRGVRCVDPGRRASMPACFAFRRRSPTRRHHVVPQPVPPIAGRSGRCYDGRRRLQLQPQLEAAIRSTVPDLDVIHVVFRPEPLSPTSAGRKVFFCCTAPPDAGPCPEGSLGGGTRMRDRWHDAIVYPIAQLCDVSSKKHRRTISFSPSSRPGRRRRRPRIRRARDGRRVRQQRTWWVWTWMTAFDRVTALRHASDAPDGSRRLGKSRMHRNDRPSTSSFPTAPACRSRRVSWRRRSWRRALRRSAPTRSPSSIEEELLGAEQVRGHAAKSCGSSRSNTILGDGRSALRRDVPQLAGRRGARSSLHRPDRWNDRRR